MLSFLKSTALSGHRHHGYYHLFHGYSTMLEGVLVVGHIVIIVVWIGKKRVARSKHIACTEVWRRQLCLVRILDYEEILAVVSKILAELIAQVCIGVAVTDYLHRPVCTYGTMVGGHDDTIIAT